MDCRKNDSSIIQINGMSILSVLITINQIEVQSSNYNSNKTKALKVKVGADYNNPPYSINNRNTKTALNVKTIGPDAVQYLGTVTK